MLGMSILLCCPAVGSAADGSVTLRYRAMVAGAPVGEAVVTVQLDGDRYLVEGDASSNGWLKSFTNWRNAFSARGRLDGRIPEPEEFSYTESDRDKSRHVVVRDGTMQVTKNGRERRPRRSPRGADVVSALFVQPACRDDHVVHTGRHVYRLIRLARGSAGCRYTVMDDDGDAFEVDLVLGRRGELVVPRRITFHSWISGRLELLSDGTEEFAR